MTYCLADLIDILNAISQNNQAAQKPADIAYGTVISVSPLSIQTVSTSPPIPAAALELTSSVVAQTATVQGGSGGTVVINPGLAAGDKVIMLRVAKGQRYIVLSKAQ